MLNDAADARRRAGSQRFLPVRWYKSEREWGDRRRTPGCNTLDPRTVAAVAAGTLHSVKVTSKMRNKAG
jgi:hypothetical protein